MPYSTATDRHSAVPLARALIAAGAQPGRVLAVQLESAQDLAEYRAAAQHLGCPFLPLAPHLGKSDKDALVASTNPALIVDRGAKVDAADSKPIAPHQWSADEVRLIVSTSGSEGTPKGVMLSHGALQLGARAACAHLDFGSNDLWCCCLPLFHIGGLAILERAEAAGGKVLLHDGFDADRVWRDIREQRVSHLSLVPVMLDRLLEVAHAPVQPSLRCVLVGGGPLTPEAMRRALDAGWPLCVSYGLTEAGSQVATLCDPSSDWQAGQVGRPLPHLEVCVDAGADGSGPLLLSGPGLMTGYANPRLPPGDGLHDGRFRSGDLGRIDPDGNLTILGRHDDILVTGGENVHPAGVEAVLKPHPPVDDAGIGALRDPNWGQMLVAVITGDIDGDTLLEWTRHRLPSHQRPRRTITAPTLPRSPLGKLDRRALQALIDASAAK